VDALRRRRRTTARSHVKLAATAVICSVALVALAACSSASGASGSASSSSADSTAKCMAAATAIIKSASTAPAVQVPPPINISSLKGKLLVFIPDSLQVPDDVDIADSIKVAAAAAGLKVRVLDGGGTTAGWLSAANEAVSLHAAAVVFHAVTPQAASGAYAALQSAGIPVVTGYPGVPSTVKYSVDVNWTKVGQLEAAYALMKTGCKTNALVYTASQFSNVVFGMNAAIATIKKYCPSCKTRTLSVDINTMATTVGQQTSGAIQSDPKVNFVLAGFDALALYIVPAVQASGANVQYIGNSGTQANFNYIKKDTVQTATVSTYSDQDEAWIYVDDAMRAMLGKPPAKQWYPMPSVVVTAQNYNATVSFWSGESTDLTSRLKTDWGLG
jgi:ribose transport system substrate-binding protein